MNKRITVIVPVYNTEIFLEKCLNSLITQTIISLLKIIIVNDGTKDNSEKIILKYKEKYPNIIEYYRKNNGGLSSARNYGINKCDTQYIAFIDSDDYIEQDMFEKMYNAIERDNADIVTCGFKICDHKGTIKSYGQINNNECINTKQAIKQILSGKIHGYAWNKLYKTNLFKDNNIKYPENRLYEDIITSYNLVRASGKICVLNDALYNYVQHNNSICHKPALKGAKDILLTLDEVMKEIKYDSFTGRMILISSQVYYQWYYTGRNKYIKNMDIIKYKRKINYYKKEVNILNILNDKDLSISLKVKYTLFNLGVLKYVYAINSKK